MIGNTELLSIQCRGIGPQLAARGSLMTFLVLRHAPGEYSRVTAGMAILNSGLFREVRTPDLVMTDTSGS